jgi:Virulence-associated protein and related proteins
MKTAKVFETGRSQAVRLPKEFRFHTSQVYIKREGNRIVLIPKPDITWEEFFLDTEPCPEFVVERDDNTEPQARNISDA